MAIVWEMTGLAAPEKLVLLSLADHADDDLSCYPAVPRLAHRTGLSQRTVQSATGRLVSRGLLKIRRSEGRLGANLYTIVLDETPAAAAPPAGSAPPQEPHPPRRSRTPAGAAPPQQLHPRMENRNANSEAGSVPPPKELHPRRSCTPAGAAPKPLREVSKSKKDSSSFSFDAFWHQYPRDRRGSKKQARAKWDRITASGVDPSDILAGLARYLLSRDVATGYAKGAVVWLNGEHWNDEPPPHAAPGTKHAGDGSGGYRNNAERRREIARRLDDGG